MNQINKDLEILERLTETKHLFFKETSKTIVGQKDILDLMLISILARGHSLLVGVPGLAKTLIIKTLSEVLDLSFKIGNIVFKFSHSFLLDTTIDKFFSIKLIKFFNIFNK